MKKHKEATAQEQSCAVASFLFFRVERTDQNEDSADHIDCRDRSRARRPLGSSGSALVEPGGIEPPSESASAGTSPGAESPFYSLARAWTLTLAGPVASLCMVRSKLCALTFAADRRLASGPRPSRRRRSLLRQREEQSYCCSLIYNCPFYGCQAHPPAIPVSAPPSKPVRPLVVAKSA